MIKQALTLLAVGTLGLRTMQAGEKNCCAKGVSKDGQDCTMNYAQLHLTPAQKSKIEALEKQCAKDGCNEASMEKFMRSAKGVLSEEQYAELQTECAQMQAGEKKS